MKQPVWLAAFGAQKGRERDLVAVGSMASLLLSLKTPLSSGNGHALYRGRDTKWMCLSSALGRVCWKLFAYWVKARKPAC